MAAGREVDAKALLKHENVEVREGAAEALDVAYRAIAQAFKQHENADSFTQLLATSARSRIERALQQ